MRREMVRMTSGEHARKLVDYLARRGIEARVEPNQYVHVVKVVDPEDYEEAMFEARPFFRDPDSPLWDIEAWRESEPMEEPPRYQVFSSGWFATVGPVTLTGLVLSGIVYLSLFVVGDVVYQMLRYPDSLDGLATQPWRLFTPALLHLSVLHIVFNMLWWLDLGRIIERFQSSLQLAWITLLVAAISNTAQFLDAGAGFGGMSGVVYGLLGYLWLYGKINPAAGYQLRRAVVVLMLVWMVVCYVALPEIVANAAHLSGLLTGVVLGTVVGLWRRSRDRIIW